MDFLRPKTFPWDYDRGEIIADGVVHAIGSGLGLIGVVIIAIAIPSTKNAPVTSVMVYPVALVAMLWISAAYNMWPVSYSYCITNFSVSPVVRLERRSMGIATTPGRERRSIAGARLRSSSECAVRDAEAEPLGR